MGVRMGETILQKGLKVLSKEGTCLCTGWHLICTLFTSVENLQALSCMTYLLLQECFPNPTDSLFSPYPSCLPSSTSSLQEHLPAQFSYWNPGSDPCGVLQGPLPPSPQLHPSPRAKVSQLDSTWHLPTLMSVSGVTNSFRHSIGPMRNGQWEEKTWRKKR